MKLYVTTLLVLIALGINLYMDTQSSEYKAYHTFKDECIASGGHVPVFGTVVKCIFPFNFKLKD